MRYLQKLSLAATPIPENSGIEPERVLNTAAPTVKALARCFRKHTKLVVPIVTLPVFLAAAASYAGRSDVAAMIVMLAPAFFYCGFAIAMIERVEKRTRWRQKRLEAEVWRRMDEFSPSEVRLSRRYFEARLEQEIKRSRRHLLPLCVVALWTSPDRDKAMHTSQLVEIAAHYLRAEDIAGRLGRHVYAICLPHTSPSGARVVVDRLRSEFPGNDVRLGIAYLEPGRNATPESMLRNALATAPAYIAA